MEAFTISDDDLVILMDLLPTVFTVNNNPTMMMTTFSGNESPSQCLQSEYEWGLPDTDNSFYGEPTFGKPTSLDKALTYDGGKVFTNLLPISRPNMDHGARNQLPGIAFFIPNDRHDSGMSSPSSTYSNLSSPIRTPPPAFSTGATPRVPRTWSTKHPLSWTTEDTLDWVIEVAHKNNIGDETRSEAFQAYTGQQLMTLPEEGFRPLSLTHYHIFYEHFNQLRRRASFTGPDAEGPLLSSTLAEPEGPMLSPMSEPLYDSGSNGPYSFDNSLAESAGTTSHLADSGAVNIQLYRFSYPVDLSDNFPEVPVTHQQHLQQQQQQQQQQRQREGTSDDGYSSGSERTAAITHPAHYTHADIHTHIPNPVIDRMEYEDDDEDEDEECEPIDNIDPKKKPEGRTRGRKPGQTTRGNHLWEFVRDLLKDSRFSPSLIKWENRELGIFRFVQSAQVAKMWGRRKNNLTMNYEKLSRAMRFCRDKKYFAALPEKGKYPKKLCFRFGERAFGWQTDD